MALSALPDGYVEKYGHPDLPVALLVFFSMQKGRRNQPLRLRAYQIRYLEFLWAAWMRRTDAAAKFCRQVGKTTILARFFAFMIVWHECSVVVSSSKIEKTKKAARIIRRAMIDSGRRMDPKGIVECRFEDSEAGFICHSGKPDAEREGDTADIVWIDEAQDVIHEAVWQDFSPMRSAVDGIVIATGIGGSEESVIETMFREPDYKVIAEGSTDEETADPTMKMRLKWDEVASEIPKYRKNVERDRLKLPVILFDAHYNVEPLPIVASALIPQIVEWPAEERFDADRADEVIIGTDWGKRVDGSACIALARFGHGLTAKYVMFSFAHYEGVGYEEQLDGMMEWQRGFAYTSLRPEENNVGVALSEFWLARLGREYNAKRILDATDAVYTSGENLYSTLKRIAAISQQGRLFVVPDGRVSQNCVDDLKKVSVKYLTGGVLKPSHSDWLSALVCCLYPSSKGVVEDAAA